MTIMPGANIQHRPAGWLPLRTWDLSVVDSFDVEPHIRRVLLTAGDLDDFTYKPGQALVLMVSGQGGETGRRDYTIRRFDQAARTLSIDVFLHGDTPAPTWDRTAKLRDRI